MKKESVKSSPEKKRLVRSFTPVSETSGSLTKILVNLRPADSELVASELAIVQALVTEIPNLHVILGIDSADIKLQDRVRSLGIPNVTLLRRAAKVRAPWARDLGFWADNGRRFVVPNQAPKQHSLHTAGIHQMSPVEIEQLREALQIDEVATSTYPFEGGDVLFSDTTTFIGHSAVDSDNGQRQAGRVFSTPLQVLGTADSASPSPHLDSGSLTVDNQTVFINDPLALFSVLATAHKGELAEWQNRFSHRLPATNQNWGAVRSFASISADVIRDIHYVNTPGTYGHDVIRGGTEREIRMMDIIQNQLRALGQKTIKLPGMSVMGIPFSPVNSLVDTYFEKGKMRRRIFLTTYGWPRLDEMIVGLVQDSGLFHKIIPLEIGWELNLCRGGLRCVVNGLHSL